MKFRPAALKGDESLLFGHSDGNRGARQRTKCRLKLKAKNLAAFNPCPA
jgi:hypothetical protein